MNADLKEAALAVVQRQSVAPALVAANRQSDNFDSSNILLLNPSIENE